MNQAKPDTFVLCMAAMSEKLLEKETHVCELTERLAQANADIRTLERKVRELEERNPPSHSIEVSIGDDMTPSGTLRSSQIPAGMGTNVRKSA